jgi:hypothetical protein
MTMHGDGYGEPEPGGANAAGPGGTPASATAAVAASMQASVQEGVHVRARAGRAHSVAEDDWISAEDDEDVVLDDDDKGPFGGGTGDDSSSEEAASTKRRMYALRANPGRLKSCRVCENCGKEFTSWKSLLDHGRCNNYEEQDEDTELSPPLRDADQEVEDMALAAERSKGKRTRPDKVMALGNGSVTEATSPSSEEEDLANCLVMLSSSRSPVQPPPVVVDVDQEQCVPESKDVAERNRFLEADPQPISMMATAAPQLKLLAPPQPVSTVPRGLFECKACKKVFTSHQALGGHRASHKKVKGCFAARLDSNRSEPPQPVAATDTSTHATKTAGIDTANADGNPMNSAGTTMAVTATAAPETAVAHANDAPTASSAVQRKGKVHECSICHRVFMSGQALGGHKRCHWLKTGSGDPVAKLHPIVAQDHHVMHAVCQQLTLGRPVFDAAAHHPILDLINNVPTNPSAATIKQQAAKLNDDSVLCPNAPTSLYMQSWDATSSRNVDAAGAAATEDEADSRNTKKVKFSDLKDMDVAGETSPWLQVGIGLPSESKEKSTEE